MIIYLWKKSNKLSSKLCPIIVAIVGLVISYITQLSHMETSTKSFKLQGRSEIKYTT